MSTSEKPLSDELRRHPRIEVPENVLVRDAHSGEILGQLVNLSVDGFMLVGPLRIPAGTVRQLCIPLAQPGAAGELTVGVESLWSQDANDSGSHWSGFQIIDISPEQQQLLDSLVGNQ